MKARRTRSSADSLPATADGKPKASARALAHIIERSSRIQGPVAAAYVERLRRADPAASPGVIVSKLEKRFLAAVTASGAAVGSAAVLPGIGTLSALSAAAGETAVFLEATAFFALATAAVYGVSADNREQRRALVLAVLVGDDSRHAMAELLGSGRRNGAWLSEGVASLPMPALSQMNSRLLKRAVRRFALRRGALLFGKILPVGIGAVIGAIGNRMVGKKIVRNTRSAFGTPPARWPVTLHLLPPVPDTR
jgi:F0F1-type ATP synthase membrane subunit c/vacuolar-type H+-ATPase subunit K